MPGLTYPLASAPAPGTVKSVVNGVYWLRLPIPMALDHINVWLLDNGDGWTLIDTGICAVETQEAWTSIFNSDVLNKKPITAIIVTHHHPDHFGLGRWLCEYFDITLNMTAAAFAEVDYLMQAASLQKNREYSEYYRAHGVDDPSLLLKFNAGDDYRNLVSGIPERMELIGDDEIIIGGNVWQPMLANGHAVGHLSLYCKALNILISGDQILPEITCNISAYAKTPDANPLDEYLKSLDGFSRLPADAIVLPSHGQVFQGLHERIEEIRNDHTLKLEQALSCCETPKSNVDVMQVIFQRELKGLHWILAFGESLAHLKYLEERRQLNRTSRDGKYHYHQ